MCLPNSTDRGNPKLITHNPKIYCQRTIKSKKNSNDNGNNHQNNHLKNRAILQ